ncbi:hypothetical protein Btru_074149 [Bulinus truncatus]|nr:hypothetical protein Btru_074149 [Bulinus truncatus]
MMFTGVNSSKFLSSGHDTQVKLPEIFDDKSYKYLQFCYPPDSLEELLSENAIEVQLDDGIFCEKFDKHGEYIPVNEFSLHHLPAEIRHKTVYIWLRSVAPLVVKLQKNGNATGRICWLAADENLSKTCEDVHCHYRRLLGRRHNVYGGLGVITNKHVIKSDNDAAVTRVEFFYNDDSLPPLISELGCSLKLSDPKFDYSVFSCYVHERSLIDAMRVLDSKRDYSWLQIPQVFRTRLKKYAIIVSHPHGKAKKISIGHVRESEVKGKGHMENISANLLLKIYNTCEKQGNIGLKRFEAYYMFFQSQQQRLPYRITWYTTATCKGSSGAPVYMGNIELEEGKERNRAHTHRGVDKLKNLNVCFT